MKWLWFLKKVQIWTIQLPFTVDSRFFLTWNWTCWLLLRWTIPPWLCLLSPLYFYFIIFFFKLFPLSLQDKGYWAKIILRFYPVHCQKSSSHSPKTLAFLHTFCPPPHLPLGVPPSPSRCQSFTVEWKMCPISPGQANNDWKAIEVKQTDSIQLVIAVFASLSTCEEISGKTQQGCHFSFCLRLPLGRLQSFYLLFCSL